MARLLRLLSLLSVAVLATCSGVITLTDKSFEHDTQAATGQTTGAWFVMLYAPWCGHCTALKPTWHELAEELDGAVNVAMVDATAEKATAKRFGKAGLLSGYPTLLLFRDRKVYKYSGSSRSLQGLAAFAKKGYSSATGLDVPPEESAWGRLTAFGAAASERLGLAKLRERYTEWAFENLALASIITGLSVAAVAALCAITLFLFIEFLNSKPAGKKD